jgi:hypothetical protein
MLSYLAGSAGVACSPILSVSFEGMGCEPVLNLAAIPDEAVSIICTIINKIILLTLWGKLVYVSYTTDQPVFSRASCRCSSYNLSLGSFDMVALCLWDALSRWRSSWIVFTCPMCKPIFFALGTSTHACSWSITDHYIIKWHVSYAWCWFWTIKALVEAEELWWHYSNSWGHNSSVDHCQTFHVFIIRPAKNLFFRQKCFTDTGCVCTSSVASNKSRHQTIGKNLFLEKRKMVSDVHQCIVVFA